jgi:hypothetical protein
MESVTCLDELLQKEDSILDRIQAAAEPIRSLIGGIHVYIGLIEPYKIAKKTFESTEYIEGMAKAPKADIKFLHDKLEEIVEKNNRIQDKLISIIKAYPQPLLKRSLKKLNDFNSYLLDVLEEMELACAPTFIAAMKKIEDGIEKSSFDISKVKAVDSIF